MPIINAVSVLTSLLSSVAAIAEKTSDEPFPMDKRVTPATDYDIFKPSAIYSSEAVKYSSAELPRRWSAKNIIKKEMGKNKYNDPLLQKVYLKVQ